MIVVKVELHSANTKKVTTLQTVIIDNVTKEGDGQKCDYRFRVLKKGHELLDFKYNKAPIREARVEKHPRHSKPVLNLLYKGLVALGYDK